MEEQKQKPETKTDQLPAAPSKSKGGRRSKLAALLEDQQDKYNQALQYLRLGATLTAVAGYLGVSPDTMSRWISRGRESSKGKYHRFWRDITAAVSHASVMVEIEVKVNHPLQWLKNGPRRLLGDEWRDEPGSTIDVQGQIDHVQFDGLAPASSNTLAAALVELKNAGLLSLPTGASPLLGPVVEGGVSSPADAESPEDPP